MNLKALALDWRSLSPSLAEREGFEPQEPLGSTVFKTAAIDHSAISPGAKIIRNFFLPKFNTHLSPHFTLTTT